MSAKLPKETLQHIQTIRNTIALELQKLDSILAGETQKPRRVSRAREVEIAERAKKATPEAIATLEEALRKNGFDF